VPNVSTVTAIAAGFNHTLVVLQDGRVGCFGSNFTSQCGRIEITDLTSPLEVGPGFRINQ
jgi:alpha-tubulin suppressor-like RCC1 family protein